jgi:8-oxo-dGTP pyrophosphatase MutT (NUDIX family)
MGSDIGKNKIDYISINKKNAAGFLQVLAAFMLGFLFSYLWTQGRTFSNNDIDCVISFGDVRYKGPQYMSDSTVGKPKCLVESKFLKVQQHSVRMEGNKEVIDDWLWIDYHDRINVLIETKRSNENSEPYFLILEQNKYALEGQKSLAIVGGIVEPGEQPESAAIREVLEETRNQCDKWYFLGRYRTDVNRGMGWTNAFIASDCQQKKSKGATTWMDEVGKADFERQNFRIMSLTEVREAVQGGKFLEIQWTATVALAMLHYEKRGISI